MDLVIITIPIMLRHYKI